MLNKNPTYSRRSFVGSAAVLSIYGVFGTVFAEEAAFSRTTHGCCINRSEFAHYSNGTSPTASYLNADEPIVSKSGNRTFDLALAQGLLDLSNAFDVLPGFAYYDDSKEGLQAFANSEDRRLGRESGTVLFGTNLLRNLLRQENGDASVLAVCAHEFGHIVQFKKKLQPKLALPDGKVKLIELHADYLAGYYAGLKKRRNADFPAVQFAVLAHSLGDFNNDSQHHGTPTERAAAIQEGFSACKDGNLDFDDAVNAGINYVLGV